MSPDASDGREDRGREATRLRDGSEVLIRPLAPEDRDLLCSGFAELSDRSRYLRFQAPMASLSEQQLSYLTEIDHHDHEALVAIDPVTGQSAGVARFVRVNEKVAEGAAPAVSAAAGLAAARDAHVHLVETYWPVLSDRDELGRRLSAAAEQVRRQGVDVTVHLVGGDAVDAVIDVAEQTDAALIVIDPRAASPATPWRAYALPARVCARAPCDVLIAR